VAFPSATLLCAALLWAVPLWVVPLWAGAARGAEIAIGLSAAPNSADPHFHALGPNNMLAGHVFDPLISVDAHLALQPALAVSWTLENGRTWRMKLRENVVFHDGTPFTAADVAYSLCRVLHPSGPTHSFQTASRALDAVQIVDDHTILLRMRVADPGFLAQLTGFYMISARRAGAGPVSFDVDSACGDIAAPPAQAFDNLTMAVGTGPYRLTAYVSGERLTLEANPRAWGEKPRWQRVQMRALPNAGARMAGLLSGELDLIENPAAQDLPVLKARGGLGYAVVPSNRMMFLQPDVERDPSPQVNGTNFLRDQRVREAISLAIDRKTITQRLLDGMAVPADRFTPPGLFAALEQAPSAAYDPARARALLAEAGAQKLSLTLAASRDRFVGDAAVAQAIGQYLTRVGITTTVDALPQVSFFPRRTKRDFSLALGSWGYGSEGSAYFQRPWLAAPDEARGYGGSNYGGYRSAAYNDVLLRALVEMDDGKRAAMLREAETMALQDRAIIPLYFDTSLWAFKDRYRYAGRADQLTRADDLALKDAP